MFPAKPQGGGSGGKRRVELSKGDGEERGGDGNLLAAYEKTIISDRESAASQTLDHWVSNKCAGSSAGKPQRHGEEGDEFNHSRGGEVSALGDQKPGS